MWQYDLGSVLPGPTGQGRPITDHYRLHLPCSLISPSAHTLNVSYCCFSMSLTEYIVLHMFLSPPAFSVPAFPCFRVLWTNLMCSPLVLRVCDSPGFWTCDHDHENSLKIPVLSSLPDPFSKIFVLQFLGLRFSDPSCPDKFCKYVFVLQLASCCPLVHSRLVMETTFTC